MPTPELGSILEAAIAEKQSNYRPYVYGCPAPTKPYEYFLVRPKGTKPNMTEVRVPTVVQYFDGKLYAANNDIVPLKWALNGQVRQGPTEDPFQANLEWCPLPL